MNRREALRAGISVLGCWQFAAQAKQEATLQRPQPPRGRLLIIGGAETRGGDLLVLRRFIALTGRQDPHIAVLTAASAFPHLVWARYDHILSDLGLTRHVHLELPSRDACDDPRSIVSILQADGIFLTGGDQRRLLDLIGNTGLETALRQAYRDNGACIAGTSAGAAAMSRDMLAGRTISDGIGLLRGALIDQHFSERRRLNRLLPAVASHPRLVGIGVDENTALVIGRQGEFEVVGAGTVTLVDARRLPDPVTDAEPERLLTMPGLRVHRLPNDASYQPGSRALTPEEQAAVQAMREVLPELVR